MALDFASDWYVTAAGQRQFNVSINGTQVLTNFDIFATAGGKDKAIQETFTATANASGQIAVAFNYGAAGTPWSTASRCFPAARRCGQINCGEMAGGTITVNPGTFTNQGTLAGQQRRGSNVNGLTGNVGNAALYGSGSSLSLAGTNYVVNQALRADQVPVLAGRHAVNNRLPLRRRRWTQ